MKKFNENKDLLSLTKEQKNDAVDKIIAYLDENFEINAGRLQSEIFLDFLTKNIGIFYYNIGISDAMSFIVEKTEDMYLLMKDE